MLLFGYVVLLYKIPYQLLSTVSCKDREKLEPLRQPYYHLRLTRIIYIIRVIYIYINSIVKCTCQVPRRSGRRYRRQVAP